VGKIISGRTTLSLLVNTFAINLYITLHKLIGWNSVSLSGFLVLGMRAMCVALIFYPNDQNLEREALHYIPPIALLPNFVGRNM
jgi:hypothetical protein